MHRLDNWVGLADLHEMEIRARQLGVPPVIWDLIVLGFSEDYIGVPKAEEIFTEWRTYFQENRIEPLRLKRA